MTTLSYVVTDVVKVGSIPEQYLASHRFLPYGTNIDIHENNLMVTQSW